MVKNPPGTQETWVQTLGGKIPWKRERLPTPVFWPGEVHELRILAGYIQYMESDMTLNFMTVLEQILETLIICPN